ncbi:MAG: ABC transporter substrate-binding protein [Anaerolineae bacterium]|nr:ABC transporter substrate-binding protein [Anaerolineae bacterium]
MSHRGSRFLLILLLGLIFGPAVLAQDAPSSQTLFMTFVPNVQFSPVYIALEKGYFADAGLDITVEHGDEPLGVDLIAAGERQLGLISGEQLLTARGRGRPVVFVYEWFQRYPVAIVAPVESGIESVQDLAGRRVGIPGRFGASYSGLTALLAANGMTEQDVDLQEIGYNAPEVVCIGGVDAAVVYINNEPLQIENRAQQGDCGDVTGVNVFPVYDAADLVSNGIVTNEATIAEHPELVSAFVGAFDRALREAIDNPAEAYLLSLPYVEGLPSDDALTAALTTAADEQTAWLADNAGVDLAARAVRRAEILAGLKEQFDSDTLIQFEVLLATIDLWDADQLGLTEADSWALTQDVLLQMGFMEAPLDDLAAAYTNDFLPAANGE